MRYFYFVVLVLFMVIFSLSVRAQTGSGGELVARAGDITISRAQLLDYLQTLPDEVRLSSDRGTLHKIIDILVQRSLLERRAIADGFADSPDIKRILRAARQSVLADAYLERVVRARITESDISSGYERYVERVSGVEEVRARHILLSSKDDALSVIDELAEVGVGGFSDLAIERSIGPSGKSGGDLGYFSRERMVPEFAAEAFSLGIGEYSVLPVKTRFGWHVVLVEDRRKVEPLSLEEVRVDLEQELLLVELDDVVGDLGKGIEIEYFSLKGLDG